MLECGFESPLRIEFSGFSMYHFLELLAGGFLQVLWFPPLLHWLMVSTNKNKAEIKAISTLSKLIAEVSLRTK